jgi:class 3 adenylate cyclase
MRNLWIAILMGVGILTLIPASALAQMGTGQRMGGGMGPATGPVMQRQEKAAVPEAPPSPGVPAATGTSRAAGASGRAMEPPAVSAPVSNEWKEWAFLVLVGVVTTAAGSFAFWFARSHGRRRSGPASFVTEAVLVVDLVDSTRLATHYGDGLAMQAKNVLKDRTLAATEGHGLAFAESTGDGYFMTFPSVLNAVQVAIGLLKDLKDRPPELSSGALLAVRAGICYGEILLDGGGIRHGAVINRTFRLEGITREAFAEVEGGIERETIPEQNRIFLDEEAAEELRTAEIPLRFVGFCSLKGFSGLHRVYEVLWGAQG